MNTLYRSILGLIGALALAGAAFAQVPSSNDTSDEYFNTGMGSGALGGSATTNEGISNTASGFDALYSNTTGNYNTASGVQALYSNTTGYMNTASGYWVLYSNTTGYMNTAFGMQALSSNTTGNSNTACGYEALIDNTTGGYNTATGDSALFNNSDGNSNTASGFQALVLNTSGSNNTATGVNALYSNTTGSNNIASGYEALFSNTGGNYNNASGYFALHNNSTGSQNSASGVQALYGNKTGNYNTASGTDALYSNTTGSTNIAEGYKAGYNLTTGSNNIDIGNQGAAGDKELIKIGTQGTQAATYIAGIYNVALSGSAVVVTSTGQLGVSSASSERFKTAIAPMGSETSKLEQLRPITFHLKSEPKGALQYGLIAEDVAKVYPELVIRDEKGRIDGVRYDELAPMLLNEVQKQQRINEAQAAQMSDLRLQVSEIHAALLMLQAKDERVAQR